MKSHLNIFAIYAQEDKAILNQILPQLKSLKKEYNLTIWSDNPILPDQIWKPKKESQLAKTDVFLLFASNTFMYSSFIQQLEFKTVIDSYKQGKSAVIPIIIDKCPWDTDFNSDDYNFNLNELKVLPKDAKPIKDWNSSEQAYSSIASGIKETISSFKGNSTVEEPIVAKPVKKEIQKEKKSEEEVKVELKIEEKPIIRKKEKVIDKVKEEVELRDPNDELSRANRLVRKKRMLIGSVIAVLAIVGIYLFNRNPDKLSQSNSDNTLSEVTDSIPLDSKNVDSDANQVSISELELGEFYKGGLIYSLSSDKKSGKVVHIDDFGPMTWVKAMKIDEQIGEGWRLPTLEELKYLRITVGQGADNTAEFSNSLYWSATDYDAYQARLLRLSDGNANFHYNKEAEHRKHKVRAILDFSL